MEEVLISIAKNTPILALLGVVLIIIFRMQEERDKKLTEERVTMIATFTQTIDKMSIANEKIAKTNGDLLNEVKDNGIELKNFVRIIDEAHLSQMQAHIYQQKEHEEMIKILGKLNGK